jgi:hypothetical protein
VLWFPEKSNQLLWDCGDVKLNGHNLCDLSAQSSELNNKGEQNRSVKCFSLLFAEVSFYFDACTLMLC